LIVKLVRDRIGDIPWDDEESKQHLGWVEPGSAEHRWLLLAKLDEEVRELATAIVGGDEPAKVVEEAADVYEVLLGLLHVAARKASHGAPHSWLAEVVATKRVQRGGFFEGRTYDGPEKPT
jgi:predicted house-cleaning noncanonical NTP pyrophosphatase (MazG superfamily)